MARVRNFNIFFFFGQSVLIEERVDQAAWPDNIIFELLLIPPFDLPGLRTVARNPTDVREYIFGVLAMAGRHIDQKRFWIGTK